MHERCENRWLVLFKFGEREHLEQLRNEGLLFMNTQSYFADLKADGIRADKFEGTSRIIQPSLTRDLTFTGPVSIRDGKVQFAEVTIPSSDLAGPTSISLDKFSCNVYCMYALTEPASPPLADAQVQGFGDSFVLVLNTQKFLERVRSAAKANYHFEYGLVEYYDADAHSGETGPFRKRAVFSWQREFRLIIRPVSPQPVRLAVGNLSDIMSTVHPLHEIDSLCDFSVEKARQAGLQ